MTSKLVFFSQKFLSLAWWIFSFMPLSQCGSAASYSECVEFTVDFGFALLCRFTGWYILINTESAYLSLLDLAIMTLASTK